MNAWSLLAREAGPSPLEQGRFPLVKYFSLTALVCMLAIAVFLGLFNQRQALESLNRLAESQNVTLTKTFSNFLWGYFEPLVESSQGKDAEELKSDSRLIYLRQIVVDTMRDTGAVKVKIYNLNGITVFSTDFEQIGESKLTNTGFLGAAQGEIKSELAHKDRFDTFEGVVSDRDLFSSYMPVRDTDGRVLAVFELYRDVTSLVSHMERSGLVVALCVVLAMLVLYGLLALIVWRAQSIIDRQGDALQDTLHQVQESNRLLDQRVQERTVELSSVNQAMEIEIRERKSAEERLEHLAHHDSLTGLPNRLLLQERIDQAIARAKRERGWFALFFIDLDNFKGINDTFGHPTGDTLLREVADELVKNLRGSDTLARLGGDEFILVAEVVDKANIELLAEKLLAIVRRPYRIADVELYLGATIGISLYPADGADSHTLIRNADTAMYQAKAGGRDQYRHYTPAMTVNVEERLRMDGELRRAMDNDELSLVYQPQVDPRQSAIIGCEALLRWHHPTMGAVPPSRFIPVAEESGLINLLGDWVLREACLEMRRWLDCGFDMPRVAVNVSPKQLEQNDIVERILRILEETGVSAERLELEITETAIMQNVKATEFLGRLWDAGISLSIDDFGTGYSSLSHLKQLPIHKLKIDRSFIMNLQPNSNDQAIIRSIIGLAKNMRLVTLAEGVETREQADILIAEGCDQAQGFLFSKPLASDDLILLWAELGQGGSSRDANLLFRL